MKVFFNHFKQTTSSNDIASEWLKQAEPGSVNVVTTDDQTGGRGQRGRAWDQRPGLDLAWSMAIKWPLEQHRGSKIPEPILFNKAVAVAIWSLVDSALPGSELTGIKWPNDILIRRDAGRMAWQKCAGMLIENAWKGERWDGSVIGVGMNVNSDRSSESGRTSLRSETKKSWDISTLAIELHETVMHQLQILEKDGRQIESAYQQALIGTNHWLPFTLQDEPGWGKIHSVDLQGNLLMQWRMNETSKARDLSVAQSNQLRWDGLDSDASA